MFNKQSKTQNVVQSSFWSGLGSIVNILLHFFVRTVFIMVLTKEYLGLNGLFTDVLQIMSLADMGIAMAITVRFYEPVKNDDPVVLGRLLNFYKTIYKRIACVITVIGLCYLPFISYLFSDTSKVPQNVNIYYIYLLYLLSTVASYFYSYRLSLLSADQKNYVLSQFNIAFNIINSLGQVGILWFLHSFTLMLTFNILTTITWNFGVSHWIKQAYPMVFVVKDTISKEEQDAIWQDTKACMLHKIGGTVLSATDSIVLTKVISLAATGIYSNYSQIINMISSFIGGILGSFVSSIGIAKLDRSKEEYYEIYKKLSFINGCIAVIVVGCTFVLINDVINTWIGEEYLLDLFSVGLICFNFYNGIYRSINISFTNACGWFIKDRYRPLVESAINLGVSIVAANYLGIAGVFLGTAISFIATVGWREPYILYHYEFQKSVKDFWLCYVRFFVFLISYCCLILYGKNALGITFVNSLWMLILESFVVVILAVLGLVICFGRTKEFGFYLQLLRTRLKI